MCFCLLSVDTCVRKVVSDNTSGQIEPVTKKQSLMHGG